MKYCDKCGISVTGERHRCPLCQHSLIGKSDGSECMLPYVPTIVKRFGIMLRIAAFAAIACGVLSVMVNMAIPQSGWWSLAVVGGIVCLFISVTCGITRWSNPPKNILYQLIIVSGCTVLWDAFTGWKGWSIDYVLPCLCVSAMIGLTLISKLLRQEAHDSMLYWLLAGMFGLIPIIFLATGVIHVKYPSLICVALSLLLIAALSIFEGRKVVLELKRRFHM